jgi:threonine/homoserine/homoserine lactone efflux protein
MAPPGAGGDVAERCAQASAYGARHGILTTLALYFWSALHFFLAVLGLGKMLREAT